MGASSPSGARAAWGSLGQGRRRRLPADAIMGYAFIAPAVILYLTFSGYPIVRGITIAFSDYRYLLPNWQPFNGIDNWVQMSRDATFFTALGRSATYASAYIPVLVILGITVAILISRVFNPVEASLYRVIAYLPVVLPIAVALLLWQQVLNNQFGYVNYFWRDVLHLPGAPRWLIDAQWIIPTFVIAGVWKQVGQTVLLFLIGLYGINTELYEAAAIDGAGAWRQFTDITVPLLRPTFVLVLVLSAGILGMAEDTLIFFPTTYGPGNAALLVGRYSYDIAFRLGDMRWGYAAAINLTVGIISMVYSGVIFRLLRGGGAD